jgi:hypothetical protein
MVHVPSAVAGSMYEKLDRVRVLIKEIEEIPNFGPDLWTMREGDKKCQLIAQEVSSVYDMLQQHVGTGDG